jgi:uncharacterized protein (DUF2164 family)
MEEKKIKLTKEQKKYVGKIIDRYLRMRLKRNIKKFTGISLY